MKTPRLGLALAAAMPLAPAAAQYPAVGDAPTHLPADAVPARCRRGAGESARAALNHAASERKARGLSTLSHRARGALPVP